MKTTKKTASKLGGGRRQGVTIPEIISAMRRGGGVVAKAAKELQITPENVEHFLAKFNCQSLIKTDAGALAVSETTVELNQEGKICRQWITSTVQTAKPKTAQDRMDDALKAIVPVAAVEAPLNSDEELVAVYVLGDPHHGLLASKAETGTEWNLQKSIETQCAAADLLVAAAPSAATGLLVNLGDFFQTDTSENGANKGYFVYDVSNRQNEIIAAGVESLKYFVVKMLTKHRMVELVNVPGNHDGTSVVWLNIALTEAFRNNPRVTIHNQPVSTHYLTYGKCMIIATHGESTVMKKPEAFALQIASDAKVQWAATEYRHALVGHVHHQKVKEVTGVTIESFRSLTARDAHTHNEGYRAQREANCLVFHREFGLTQRIIKGIGEIEAAIERSKKASALN